MRLNRYYSTYIHQHAESVFRIQPGVSAMRVTPGRGFPKICTLKECKEN